jgi:hypothetical protein
MKIGEWSCYAWAAEKHSLWHRLKIKLYSIVHSEKEFLNPEGNLREKLTPLLPLEIFPEFKGTVAKGNNFLPIVKEISRESQGNIP